MTEIEEQIKETYKRYEAESLKLKDQWNEQYSQIREIINELLSNDKGQEHPATDKLIKIITNHNSATSQNIGNYKTAYETLIPQLNSLSDLNCNQLLNLLPKAELIYTQWMANNTGYGQLFGDYANSLEKTLENLSMAQDKL